MSIVFESSIKMDAKGVWYIILTDTLHKKTAICKSVAEYAKKVEAFGVSHNAKIDEVKWFKDDNVSTEVMHEIRAEMLEQKNSLEDT